MNGGAIIGNYSESDRGWDIAVQGSGSVASIHSGGINGTAYAASGGKIKIFGGYFGEKAQKTLAPMLTGGIIFTPNLDSAIKYPQTNYPFKVTNGSNIAVSDRNGNVDYVNDLSSFSRMDNDGAVYKLLQNIHLEHRLTVPRNTSVTLDLNGFVLKSNSTNTVIYNEGDLIVIDSAPETEHAYYVDGYDYIWDDDFGSITLLGGAITGGSHSGDGGGIINKGTLTLNSGNIVGNNCGGNGGGILNNGTVNIKGGSIQGNYASAKGGGICNMEGGNVNMHGGSIADNKSLVSGDELCNYGSTSSVFVHNGGIKGEIISQSGTVVINGGYFGHTAKRSINESWQGDASTWGSNLNTNPSYPSNLYPYILQLPMILREDRNGNTNYITDIKSFTTMNIDGAKYTLLQDVTLETDAQITVSADKSIILDLNGFVIKGSGQNSIINNNGTLTINDSNPDAQHLYTLSSNGLYVLDDVGGSIVLSGGAITGGTSPRDGGGITNNGTLNLNGGTIVGNKSNIAGGGIYNAKILNINQGQIIGNVANNGGGISTPGSGSAITTITGGTIAYNKAMANGDEIFNWGGASETRINGGAIKGEIVRQYGKISVTAGLFGIEAKQSIDISWVDEKAEWSTTAGGDPDFPYKLGIIFICKIPPAGNASYISDLRTFDALNTDGATYKLMHNVQLQKGSLNVPAYASVTLDVNGFILKGTGSDRVINNNGTLTIIDSAQTAVHTYTEKSNGLYIWNNTGGSVTLKGGAITGGSITYGDGGGILNNGTLILNGGNIVGNTTLDNGGGIGGDGSLTIRGGNIVGNRSNTNGGGVYTGSALTMYGGTIRDNNADNNGNDIFFLRDCNADIIGGGIKGKIYSNGCNVKISGAYFGYEAANSIPQTWIIDGLAMVNNNGLSYQYPESDYPYMAESVYIDVITDTESQSSIHDLTTFTTMNIHGATYKLLRDVYVISGELLVPWNTTVILDLNGFVLEGSGNGSVIKNRGTLIITDSSPDTAHRYTVGSNGLYIRDENRGTVTIYGGAITGGESSNNGGCINNAGGVVTLDDGN
ncbi:MAG: hypothetical protein J6Q42_05145, partial [Clostridia bacterium]|nr:hypothetical protein [Clostridia bacterium]